MPNRATEIKRRTNCWLEWKQQNFRKQISLLDKQANVRWQEITARKEWATRQNNAVGPLITTMCILCGIYLMLVLLFILRPRGVPIPFSPHKSFLSEISSIFVRFHAANASPKCLSSFNIYETIETKAEIVHSIGDVRAESFSSHFFLHRRLPRAIVKTEKISLFIKNGERFINKCNSLVSSLFISYFFYFR